LKCIELPGFLLANERGIRVEDKRWGDLVLVSSDDTKVCVVECEIRAKLDLHQNPEEKAFWGDRGYGTEIERAFRGRTIFYVVLGAQRKLSPRHDHRITTVQKYWEDLDDGYPHTMPLAADLYQALADLGVGRFKLRHTRNMKLGKNSQHAAKAYGILEGAYIRLDLAERKFRPDTVYKTETDWNFGLEIRRSDRASDASPHGKLQSVVAPVDSSVGWFGYQQEDADSGPCLAVWFYTGSRAAERNVSKKLRLYAEVILHPTDAGGYNQPYVKLPVHDLQKENCSEQDWFVRVIEPITK
jgi:hypothetical protein